MKPTRVFPVSLLLAFLLAFAPVAATAAAPEPVGPAFDVKATGSLVEVSFALTLSEVSSYPVTITAIRGQVEEVLWEGSLSEGLYRFSGQLARISGSGPLKVILKTRMTNRSAQGNQSFMIYQKWEGSN